MTLHLPSQLFRPVILLAWAPVLAIAADTRPLTAQGLPPEVLADRFLVQADRHIRNEDFGAALEALYRILALQTEHGLELPDDFWIKQAQVAFGAGEYDQALAGATRYLEVAGSDGAEYMTALELLDEAVAEGCAPGPDFLRATPEMVRQCVALGADLGAEDEYGSTVLQWAGYHADSAVTEILIDAGLFPAPVRGRSGPVFRDCDTCPEMVVVPPGSFMMGSPVSEAGRSDDEGPRHEVTIAYPLAVGVYELTFAEWDACVSAGRCGGYRPDDEGDGRGRRPVIHVSWEDAQAYVEWLSSETGQEYRLLSEAEWEYVARAGTRTARYWGESESAQCRYGNGLDSDAEREYSEHIAEQGFEPVQCRDGYVETAPVGSYEPNAFGLYDVLGNVREWTDDCRADSYVNATTDGSLRRGGDCSDRVLRGGSWNYEPDDLRSASRNRLSAGNRFDIDGFRLARTIN